MHQVSPMFHNPQILVSFQDQFQIQRFLGRFGQAVEVQRVIVSVIYNPCRNGFAGRGVNRTKYSTTVVLAFALSRLNETFIAYS